MKRLLSLVLVACVAAGPTYVSPQGSEKLNCLEQEQHEMFTCFLVKTNSYLNKATRSGDIKLIDGLTFVRITPMEDSDQNVEMSEVKIMNELPRSSDRLSFLMSMLYDSAVSFFKSHSLKFNMSEGRISRALTEGRAKIKKIILPIIAAVGIKILALLGGGLGLLVLKALVYGKIALLIAASMIFQKFFSKQASGPPAYEQYSNIAWPSTNGWSAGQQQGYKDPDYADVHNLAYSAHVRNP